MKNETESQEQQELFREQLSTVEKSGKRKWIFPKKPKGAYYNKRTIVSWVYYLLFFSLPLLHVHGKPLFKFNFLKGEYIVFGKIFWPQDFLILGLIALAGLLFVALFTMVFGRFFCGWICPQTVFMELLFRKIDYWILGDGATMKHLANQKWNATKVRKYTIRYVLYFLMSFLIANTFLAYIIGIDDLVNIITEPLNSHIGGFVSILLFSFVFFSVFAFLREQVCTNICPYGRLQGVLLDKHTINVIYDYKRGEPRGKYTKNKVQVANLGDCIDCNQCVQVCPTGIDIRNGVQLECTNCTACIDACNVIMENIGRAKGLIRYDSEVNVQEGTSFEITGKIKVYSAALVGILMAIGAMLWTRNDVGVKLLRSAGLTYQERGTDSLSNLYTVNLENKTNDTLYINFSLEEALGTIQMVGNPTIEILPAGRASSSFFVVLPRLAITDRNSKIGIELYQNGVKKQHLTTNFLAPIKKAR